MACEKPEIISGKIDDFWPVLNQHFLYQLLALKLKYLERAMVFRYYYD